MLSQLPRDILGIVGEYSLRKPNKIIDWVNSEDITLSKKWWAISNPVTTDMIIDEIHKSRKNISYGKTERYTPDVLKREDCIELLIEMNHLTYSPRNTLVFTHPYNLEGWKKLCENPYAIHIVEDHLSIHTIRPSMEKYKKDYSYSIYNDPKLTESQKYILQCMKELSANQWAIHIFQQFPHLIFWDTFSENSNSGDMLYDPDTVNDIERKPHPYIEWFSLCKNQSPQAIDIITLITQQYRKHSDNIDIVFKSVLASNPSAIDMIRKNKEKCLEDYLDYLCDNPHPEVIEWLVTAYPIEKYSSMWIWGKLFETHPHVMRLLHEFNDYIINGRIPEYITEKLSKNPAAIAYLEKHQELIAWNHMLTNPGIFELDQFVWKRKKEAWIEEIYH